MADGDWDTMEKLQEECIASMQRRDMAVGEARDTGQHEYAFSCLFFCYFQSS